MIRISKTSKLDGILSWSLQAIETCPGSKAVDGGLVEACRGCYATQGNYRFANVKAPREENREDWKRDGWVADMAQALSNSRFFRWFDSGDCYDVRLARKIHAVMLATPDVKHWLPTRMHKFVKFAEVFAAMDALPNVVVRRSGDEVITTSKPVQSDKTASVIVADDTVQTGAKLCEAYKNDGKCNGCRACYDKAVKVIAYPAHGKAMSKVIRLKVAA